MDGSLGVLNKSLGLTGTYCQPCSERNVETTKFRTSVARQTCSIPEHAYRHSPRSRNRLQTIPSFAELILLEIVQIAGHLVPLDLLHLARSACVFRNILMSKQSRPLWRAAWKNVDAPECPDDLSDPQYTVLLFEKGFCLVSIWCVDQY